MAQSRSTTYGRTVLQKHNRKFTEAYEQEIDNKSGSFAGRHGAASKVMDFFRRRSRNGERERERGERALVEGWRQSNRGDRRLGALSDAEEDKTLIDSAPPRWNDPGWLNETLIVEGFLPELARYGSSTLDDMMKHDDNIKITMMELTIHKRTQPFAQGATRLAFYARTAASASTAASANRFVLKKFKRGGKQLAHLAEDMRCQALCKAFALEFNALSREEQSIDFIVTTCLKGKSGLASSEEFMSLEPFIEGTYVKYNNNYSYVNEEIPSNRFNQAAQAFSHFTFERSRGQFLVSGLQCVEHVLIDPAIHAFDPERFKLADTNLGQDGLKLFFITHVCNDICRKLELKSDLSMISSGKFQFREKWPSINNTVCCSNKLCGRIVRQASAKTADKFSEYYWCDVCLP